MPPERLLEASLLIALYLVRSERAFCEELECNLSCHGCLDMDLMKRSFDATVFTKNRYRLLVHDAEGLLSDEHFGVDGILIEAGPRGPAGLPSPDPEGKPARPSGGSAGASGWAPDAGLPPTHAGD